MSIRLKVLLGAAFLLLVSTVGTFTIVGNLRALVLNQQLIVFKDRIFHEHERARELIQSARALLYQHQAGYSRDIDQIVSDISEFETIVSSIPPHYRQNFRERHCLTCHPDAQGDIHDLEDTLQGILLKLDRYRQSVSIVLTTNDPEARILNTGIANALGEEILATIAAVNGKAAAMVAELRTHSTGLLARSERAIEASVAAVGLVFLLTTVTFLIAFNRIFTSLLRGTESVAHDDLSHRLPDAARSDEVGILAARFNSMAEHLQERDGQLRQKAAELEAANRLLHDLNENLEAKVAERTTELQRSLADVRRTTGALADSKARLEGANQELLRANQAKANFLSIISHELKTPLSVINGFLSLILDERYQNDPEHLREAVQISKRRGEQLSRMIDELIDLSRLDARAMVLRRAPTDLGALLAEIGQLFREEFDRRHLRYTLRVSPGLPPVSCDADKIRQVLTNLVGNALKFSPDGGEIELAAEERDAEVVIHCRDTGIGIPAAELEKIFEKFYQVDSSATRRFGGAGLGLSIVREIVHLHGGRVWAESSTGKGSTFFVALPREAPPENGARAAPAQSASPAS